MKSGITTHIIDLTNGKPGKGIPVQLWRIENEERIFLKEALTNNDGRVEKPFIESFETGEYELLFFVENYMKESDHRIPFLTKIPIRFQVNKDETHYHIPLLLTRWGYQTYRGS